MPYKRRYRKRRKYKSRRRFRRRRLKRRNRIKYTISRQLQPDCAYVKLKYNEVIPRSPLNFTDSYVFRINSLFDPNFTGVGGQPAGFDQYASLFTRYQVFGSSIKVNLINRQSNNTILFCLFPSQSASGVIFQDAIIQPYAKQITCGPMTAVNSKYVKSFCRVKKFIGRNVDDVGYSALTSGNPLNVIFWILSTYNADGSTVLSYVLNIQMVFYCKFWQRLNPIDL